MKSKELREKRGVIAQVMKKFNDKIEAESRDFTPDEDAKWAEINGDYNNLSKQIERAERLEEIDSNRSQLPKRPDAGPKESEEHSGPTDEQRALAFQAWAIAGKVDLNDDHREACRATNIQPGRDLIINLPDTQRTKAMQRAYRSAHPSIAEERAMSAVVGVSGGFTVPEGFMNDWEIALLNFSGVRQVAEVIRTDTGNDLPWPTTDDTGNEGERIGENTAVSEQDITVGQIIWKAYKYSSKMVKVPVELLEDSTFNVAAMLGSMLGERIGRITNRETTTGTGAAQPNGIVTAAAAGPTTAAAGAIAADELFDLEHSIDSAYRVGPGVGFMLHDQVLLQIRKLKDGNGQYLWQSGLQAGTADRLLNWPVTMNQNMTATISTGRRTILFGLLSKYKIREVRQIRMRRLAERYAESDQEAFLAFLRLDGGLLDAGTNPVKALVQA